MSCLLSVLWLILMRFMASLMVWISVLMVPMGLGTLASYSGYRLYGAFTSSNPESTKNFLEVSWTPYFMEDLLVLRDTWLILTIFLGTLLIIILVLLIFLRQRIVLAIALIQQGSRAVAQMFSSLIFPLIPGILQLVS